jgi:hypothetical protein
MRKLTLDDCVYFCMRNGEWWTFWSLQQSIKHKTDVFYGEPTISAAIRNLRKEPARFKYNLPRIGEVVMKRKKFNSKGFEYKLIIGEKNDRR